MILDRLSLSHLWINKLCVLQDDEPDRVSNMNQVTQIFSQAFIGIGAASSLDPYSGLFARRDPHLVTLTVLNFPVDSTNTVLYI